MLKVFIQILERKMELYMQRGGQNPSSSSAVNEPVTTEKLSWILSVAVCEMKVWTRLLAPKQICWRRTELQGI